LISRIIFKEGGGLLDLLERGFDRAGQSIEFTLWSATPLITSIPLGFADYSR
jgi:hypothetical protein